MGMFREIIAGLFHRLPEGDHNSPPQKLLLPETEFFPPPPTSARRDVVVVWPGKVLVSLSGSTLTILVDYPSGVDMLSDEVPGLFGDEPDVSCTIGGTSAHVYRLLHGPRRLGFGILVPNEVNFADLRGQAVSLVWTGAHPGVKNQVECRVRAKKV
jgi:hypothetical protein